MQLSFLKEFSFPWNKIRLVILLTLVAGFLFTGYASLLKTVTIEVDGKQIKLNTTQPTVARALDAAGIKLDFGDLVLPSVTDKLKSGMTIKIARGRTLKIEDGHKVVEMRVPFPDTDMVLKNAGLKLGPKDRIEANFPTQNEALYLNLIRVEEKIIEEIVEIPFATKKEAAEDIPQGARKLIKEGTTGLTKKYVQVTYENGREVARRMINQEILRKPQPEIIAYGTMRRASVAARSVSPVQSPSHDAKTITVEATAYTHTGNPTATGSYPRVGTIAVDPKVIKLGSKLYVEGYGYGKALDTGGAIKGNRIDVFFDSRAEALQWGRKRVKVQILDP